MKTESRQSQIKNSAAYSGVAALNYSGNFIEGFGESIVAIFLLFVKIIVEAVLGVSSFVWRKSHLLRQKISYAAKYLGIAISSPFLKIWNQWARLGKNVKTARAEKGRAAAFSTLAVELHGIFLGKNGVVVSIFNLAAPILSVLFFYNLVTYNLGIGYAVRLEIDGELYGYIENEQVFTEAEKYIDSRLNYLGSSKQINVRPTYTIEKLGYGELLNPIQIADMILSKSDLSVEYAFGIYMNGALVGAVQDNTGIKRALDGILDNYRSGYPDEELAFVQNVECEQGGIYTTESIIDPNLIINQITSLKQQAQYYEVENGDSHSLIGDKLGMTIAEIEELNPGFSDMALRAGDKIQYSIDVPFLDVSITRTEVYETPIPYRTTYVEDDSMFLGTSKVDQEGVNGINEITAKVAKVNQEERKRDVVSTRNLSQSVDEIIRRGTRIPLSGTVSTAQASYGKFIWPIDPNGPAYVSELTYADGGYYNHQGIDFAGPYGTPVYAGGSGVVVHSGVYYNFGRTVIIQHDNGLRTLYAHNSTLQVAQGDVVAQGQQIANIGATGRANGNHVHFEVIQGNTKINPRLFLDGIVGRNSYYN